jgi:hypothetical protein
MDKWSKRLLGGAGTVLIIVLLVSTAMAAGNFYIPGSRDIEGGLGEDGKSFEKLHIGNRITFEGTTSDGSEATIVVPDPGSDITYTMPATSGTLSISGASPVGSTLTDGAMLIGNSAGTAVEVTPSGDWTITNAGVSTLAANSCGTSAVFTNAVTLTVAAGTSTNTVTVDSGHVFAGGYISTMGSINTLSSPDNGISYDGSGVWRVTLTNTIGPNPATWTLNFISDN